MPSRTIQIDRLQVNPSNDRHGEVRNEDAAIAELFRLRGDHMRNLARDIQREGRLYERPLVRQQGDHFVVYDGNRRVTCLKLIIEPHRAPSRELIEFFTDLQDGWNGALPEAIECDLEDDLEIIDSTLFRRHTGVQRGVGQSAWDPRAKRNFEQRTGRNERIDVAEEVERFLHARNELPGRQIPRSTVNRLLSSEATRNRVGLSVLNNEFRLTHDPAIVAPALTRIVTDMANRNIVLADVWSNEDKRRYLDQLEGERLLPRAEDYIVPEEQDVLRRRRRPQRQRVQLEPRRQSTFIPTNIADIEWPADQQRIRLVWQELQSLNVETFPNAVSALMRILIELSIESYIAHHGLANRDSLGQNFRIVIDHLLERGAIDDEHHGELDRIRRGDELISVRSIQRFIHSNRFAPMPNEIITYWLRLGDFLRFVVTR